ncbi:hypothetical protein [Sporolactobacillus terrae]|uniref:hypothetical protein n=1 Tax=Sporolactobacillus terrae TaxID=269673 RepID=UPI00048CFC41|nr:hypothetical protein [Sporolactobacillus terrae]
MAMPEPPSDITVACLEKRYMKRQRGETYTALDNGIVDFMWSKAEVKKFIQLWKDGASLMWLSAHFHRPQKDIGVLIMDLRLRNKIKQREGGLLG